MEVRYARLLPADFEGRLKEAPLVYIPVGSLEYHGDHLAIGNDSLKMEALCICAARISGGVVFPAIFTAGAGGLTRFGTRYTFEGGIPLREELVKELLLGVLQELEKNGFKAATLITGHTSAGQRKLMPEVASAYNKTGKMLVVGTNDAVFANKWGHTSDHAAKWETSLLWHFYPELVDITRLPKDLSIRPEGVGGLDPRIHASPLLGKEAARRIAKELAALGSKTLKKAYRLHPGKAMRIRHWIKTVKRNLKVPHGSTKSFALADNFYVYGENKSRAKCMTTARVNYDEKNLHFVVETTIPGWQEKSVRRMRAIEKGECIEIFIAPDMKSPARYYHIGFSPSGALRFCEGNPEGFRAIGSCKDGIWITKATLPAKNIGVKALKKGIVLSGNFCRSSACAGELSSWNKTFYAFAETEAFGRMTLI